MSQYTTKVYVVQQFTRDGQPREVIAVKLTHKEARKLATDNAPAKVIPVIADKTPYPNIAEQ